MMTYKATIQHHTISSAPVIDLKTDDLRVAKRRATSEFGDGFDNHTIVVIGEQTAENPGGIVSRRRIAGRRWTNFA